VTFVIGEPCIETMDQSCVEVCPVDCIHVTEHMLVIDPLECIDCAACEAECPVRAISSEPDLPEAWMPFLAINAAIAEGANAVDDRVEAYLKRT
jgi:ferredoxin